MPDIALSVTKTIPVARIAQVRLNQYGACLRPGRWQLNKLAYFQNVLVCYSNVESARLPKALAEVVRQCHVRRLGE